MTECQHSAVIFVLTEGGYFEQCADCPEQVSPVIDMEEPHACDECGTVYDEATGDGYCGLCPECADAGAEPAA